MNITLYTIAQEHRAMVDRLMETQDDAAAIADTIEAESWPLELKAQNTAFAIKQLEALAMSVKQVEQEISERRKRIEKRAESVKEYLKQCMEIAGMTKIECPQFQIAIQKNPASIDIFEPALIPSEFMRQPEPPPPAPDKGAIKAAIQNGKEVPGATIKQGTRLVIK